jgi:hypothetical protein
MHYLLQYDCNSNASRVILTALQPLTLFEKCAPSFFGPSMCPILYCNLTYPAIRTRISFLRNSVDIPSLPALSCSAYRDVTYSAFLAAPHIWPKMDRSTHIKNTNKPPL